MLYEIAVVEIDFEWQPGGLAAARSRAACDRSIP